MRGERINREQTKQTHTPHVPETAQQTSEPDIMELQRTIGNQAVQRLMAEGRLNLAGNVVQTKLTVGEPDDQYEQEADTVAKQVMSMPDTVQREDIGPLPEDELQAKRIQREELPEEEESPLQAKSTGSVPEVTDDIESQINSSKGGGQAMPDNTRDFFESRFGQDFSSVNIHTGSESDALNNQLQAKAFTTGSDIYFKQGEYNPNSSDGQELLAHELTHVVQQGASQPVQKKSDEDCDGC